ncbi:MAG: Rrf2 family transcriptional regulator [Endomicrobium sp.]|jgi:Rrf2 family protein|nr:Rrf2 family transcriptional regulator [Endomicrobium sp.]
MRISAKARYGLSSMICLAQKYNTGECTTIISLSERLKISKIYLEQVFSLLKRANLVSSTKGSQGGYQIVVVPKKISVYDILSSIEAALFEKTGKTVAESDEAIEKAMHQTVFKKLDENIKEVLSKITLADLTNETEKQSSKDGYMFYL